MTCGEPLEYHDTARELMCTVCGAVERGHISCPNGHYVCETCHNRDAVEVIRQLALTTKAVDPFEIAEAAMALRDLPMLGCHHAFIAGGSLAAALRNRGVERFSDSAIQEVFERTSRQAQGGYCGLTGVCGITPAIGACVAVLTGSRCGADEEQRLVMEVATRVSRAIAGLTGPSCCKAYVRVSLETAADFLAESFAIELGDGRRLTCVDAARHPHGCREALCPYFEPHGEETLRRSVMSDTVDLQGALAKRADLDGLVTRAIELGAEKARVIDTSTVAVGEWVALKCKYGCAFYDRDAYHPPYAPDPQAMRSVLGEYKKAILLSGPKGKPLTEAATRLEGEAYDAGYYKAFALTALSSGGGAT